MGNHAEKFGATLKHVDVTARWAASGGGNRMKGFVRIMSGSFERKRWVLTGVEKMLEGTSSRHYTPLFFVYFKLGTFRFAGRLLQSRLL